MVSISGEQACLFALILNFIVENEQLEEIYFILEGAGFDNPDAALQDLLSDLEEQL